MAGQNGGPTPQRHGRQLSPQEQQLIARQKYIDAQRKAAHHHAAQRERYQAALAHHQALQREHARRQHQPPERPVNLVIKITQPTIKVPGKLNPRGNEDTTVKLWIVACVIAAVLLAIGTATPPGKAVVRKATGQPAKVKPAKLSHPALDAGQLRIAAIIIARGEELSHKEGLSPKYTRKAQIIGVATGLGESSLRNVMHGDSYGPDSIGVFQQRNPWGPRSKRTNPAGATTLFYTANKGPGVRGLFHTKGWKDMTVTQAAHNVQHNRYPYAYAKYAGIAAQLVDQAHKSRKR